MSSSPKQTVNVLLIVTVLASLIIQATAQRTPILTDTERSLKAKYESIQGGMTLRQVTAIMGRRYTEYDSNENIAAWSYGENTLAVMLVNGKVIMKAALGGHFDQMRLKEEFRDEMQKQVALSKERHKGITSYDGVLVSTGQLTGNLSLSEKFEEIRDGMTTSQVLALLGHPNTAVKAIPARGTLKGKQTYTGIWSVGDGIFIKIIFVNNKVVESEM